MRTGQKKSLLAVALIALVALLSAGATPLAFAKLPPDAADVLAGRKLPPIREIPAPKQPGAIPLYPGAKDEGPAEQWEIFAGGRVVRNVVSPTLTPVLPDPAKATGCAVIIAPGGAFRYLGMDGEGHDIAQRFADKGIAAFVLKYRLLPVPRDPQVFWRSLFIWLGKFAARPPAEKGLALSFVPKTSIEDAQAAVRLVRSRAAEWHVDPKRVGFVGFSAGAMLSIAVGLTRDSSARPDFIAPIYGQLELATVPPYVPPLFMAIALDDPLLPCETGCLMPAWIKAHRPVEAHFYEHGGHGFASHVQGTTSDIWFEELYTWIRDRGELTQEK